jgi:hypothetical protein
MPSIGQELLDVPFAELVKNLAFAIAEGQLELDRASIETLKFLVATQVPIIPEITEIIEPTVQNIQINGPNGPQTIPVTGASVRASGATPVSVSLLQAGLQPSFYQFTEATLEVKMSISIKQTEDRQTESGGSSGSSRPLAARVGLTRAFASPVNYRTKNTYSYEAQGSSVMRAVMRPVPPPPRLTPSLVTINTLVSPPTVTRTQ